MKLYLIDNALFHLCPARYQEYHCHYVLKKDDYCYCNSWSDCKLKYPSILIIGSIHGIERWKKNMTNYISVNRFNEKYYNAPYIDLSLI